MHNGRNILFIVLILAGVVLAYGYAQGKERVRYHKEYSFSLAAIQMLKIDGVDAQIKLIPIEGNEIKVDISGSLAQNQKPIEAMQQGSQLVISRDEGWLHFFNFNFGQYHAKDVINVYVNPNYNQDILIHSVSAPVTIQSIKARALSVENVSGAIEMSEIQCDTAKISTVSGRITARGLVTAESNVSSTSGAIELSGYAGDLKGESVSGKFAAEYLRFDDDVNIHNVSGRIVVKLTGANNFRLSTGSVSGRLTNEFDNTTLGNGKNTVRLETVSGGITVQK